MVDLLRKIGKFIGIFFFYSSLCYGGITINKNNVIINNNFQIVVEGDYKSSDIIFDYPKEFFTLHNTEESTKRSMYIVNGQITKSNVHSFYYILSANKEGVYTIKVKAGNEEKSFNVTIVKDIERKNFFIKPIVNDLDLYPGLEGKIEYYIYADPQISLQGLTNKRSLPQGKGVVINWTNYIEDIKKEDVVEDGVAYHRYKVLEGNFSAYEEKSFEINPYVQEVVVKEEDNNSDNFFDFFLGSTQKKMTLQSQKISFSTKSFPKPIPNNFLKILITSNIQGNFFISSDRIGENQQVGADFIIDNTNYKGIINSDLLQKMIFEDCYDKIFFTSHQQEIIDQKTVIRWNMSAIENCSLESKAINFSYFNPTLKKYQDFTILRPEIFVDKLMNKKQVDQPMNQISHSNDFENYVYVFFKILYNLLLIMFVSVGLFFSFKFIFLRPVPRYKMLINNFLKKPNYKNFFLIMLFLSKKNSFDSLFLDFEHKDYFLELKNMLSSFKYKEEKEVVFKKNKKAFKELAKEMKLL